MKAILAIEILLTLGCGDDEIAWNGKEISPVLLEHELNVHYKGEEEHVLAKDVRITYYKNGDAPNCKGTLLSMVKNRFNDAIKE